MTGKGPALNRRVWQLFGRAGFQTRPNATNPDEEKVSLHGRDRTLDLVATDEALGVKIISSNKARASLTESITAYLNDLKELKKAARASGAVFVVPELEITDNDKSFALKQGLRLWGKEELEYFETLADTIGPYAKFEIIHHLGISTNEETQILNVLALRLRQPFNDSNTELFLFTMPPEKLLRATVVLRRAAGSKDAYQRILQKKRLAKVMKFVTQKNALLPPNIIVHLGEFVTWQEIPIPEKDSESRRITISRAQDCQVVILRIPYKYASLELIDGQHRLFGFVQTEPETRENFNLVVLGIANLSQERRTNTFVSINDNARRMDANLVACLKYTDDEGACYRDNVLMALKVVVELNKVTPFKKAIRLLDVGNQRITLKGFAGYDLKGLLGERGQLRRYYQHDSREYVAVLRMYFGVLRSMFPEQWRNPHDYIIFTNRGISAFLKLLKSILKTHRGRLDEAAIRRYLVPLKSGWKSSNWRIKALQSTYVGSQGWKQFHRDLVAVIRKAIPSFVE